MRVDTRQNPVYVIRGTWKYVLLINNAFPKVAARHVVKISPNSKPYLISNVTSCISLLKCKKKKWRFVSAV